MDFHRKINETTFVGLKFNSFINLCFHRHFRKIDHDDSQSPSTVTQKCNCKL